MSIGYEARANRGVLSVDLSLSLKRPCHLAFAKLGGARNCGESVAHLLRFAELRSQAWWRCTLLALMFGLFAPVFTQWMLASPPAFIATLAGLAMLRVLQAAFTTAFAGKFKLSALITFLITVSGISILNIGAPFWGLIFGFIVSWLIERNDYKIEE